MTSLHHRPDPSRHSGAQNRPPRATPPAPRPASRPAAVTCPVCGHTDGFILEQGGFGYRVLEDEADTDLLGDTVTADEDPPLIQCIHCKTTLTPVEGLRLAGDPPSPVRGQKRTQKEGGHHRPHDAGEARWRTLGDGTRLPACPQCPRKNGFLADLDGVAYHVLEDDRDVDLLGEVENLLCPDCGAVFTIKAQA